MAETANGCLVLHRTGTIAERHKPRAEELEKTFHALLRSASGELFSLDKEPYHESRGIFLMLHLAAPQLYRDRLRHDAHCVFSPALQFVMTMIGIMLVCPTSCAAMNP